MLSSLRRLVSSNGSAAAGDRRSAQSVLSSPRKRRAASVGLQDTFSAFTDDWAAIEADLTSPDQAALHHGVSRSNLPQALERLGQAIVQESLTTDEVEDGLGPCMEYLLKKDILGIIVRSALTDRPSGVLIEAVKFFQTLVAHLGDRLLSQQAVNKPLVKLIRHCVGDEDVDSAWGQEAGFDVAEDRESQRRDRSEQARLDKALVGLMAFVASKLHGSPELLHIFFHNRLRDSARRKGSHDVPTKGGEPHETSDLVVPGSPRSDSSMSTVKADGPAVRSLQDDVPSSASSYDFPLFTYLLRFVHLEGETGQLARAGLSVIVQVALEARPPLEGLSLEPSNGGKGISGDVGSSATSDLAEYIAKSDFVDVLGASLGAVWGLLPSKLAFVHQEVAGEEQRSAEGGMKLGAGQRPSDPGEAELERLRRLNIEQSSDQKTIERLRLFIDILDFVQHDVVGRAAQHSGSFLDKRAMASHELVTRLSRSIRQSLLENVLSLSMIESGDRDGSAVAIMSYLEVLLSALDDRCALSDDIMGWLVRQDEHYLAVTSEDAPVNVMSRRKSAALLQLEKSKAAEAIYDPLLHYTIKDLILDHIAPTISDASVTAALGLARCLFTDHGRFAPYGLIKVIADDDSTTFPVYLPPIRTPGEASDKTEPISSPELDRLLDQTDRRSSDDTKRSLAQHFREIDLYLSLSAALGSPARANAMPPVSGMGACSSTDYEKYLQDAETDLLRNSMYLYGLEHGLTHSPSGSMSTNTSANTSHDLSYPAFRHRLDPTEPLLRSILSRLRRFFEQPPDVNVALTGAITAIALCPYRSMNGWMAFERPATSVPDSKQAEEVYDWKKGPQLRSSQRETNGSKLSQVPIVLELLHRLVQHVQNYRAAVSEFDTFLNERRKGLLFVENITEALADAEDDDDESFFAQGSTGASALKIEKARLKLWKSVGWDALSQTEIGDVHVLDTREPKLPPRQTEMASQRPLESSPSTFTRLFGRSPAAKSKAMRQSEPASPQTGAGAGDKEARALPFAEHYRQTAAITLQPSFVAMPQGPWSTSRASTNGSGRVGKRERGSQSSAVSSASSPPLDDGSDSGISLGKVEKRTRFQLPQKEAEQSPNKGTPGKERSAPPFGLFPSASDSQEQQEDSFLVADAQHFAYPGLDEDEDEEARRTRNRVTLSDLLDNVVLLEEFIKELAAVLQMRRTLGIDAVRMFE